ncbi:hypothetical protein [Pedosphaera parvula]|nr:hypothetical protein [Pedosphaera parvula]
MKRLMLAGLSRGARARVGGPGSAESQTMSEFESFQTGTSLIPPIN